MRVHVSCLWGVLIASSAAGQVVIDRTEYGGRLRGFWLAQSIANWTGRATEAHRTTAPFYTDDDWAARSLTYRLFDPWNADDDTDIEYAYLGMMHAHQTHMLTATQIEQGWKQHINRMIWVSNATARNLMTNGVSPASTGLPTSNANHLMIDAQLTTEFFGAFAPAAPAMGLEIGLLPMRTTSSGHATHASQYFAALHSLVPMVPSGLSDQQKVQWLSEQARRYIPDTSKAADIIDFVTADFEANPDKNDWESTRDKLHQRYQAQAGANGFLYRGWYESSVNLGSGVVALLYGGGDFKRTVQIGTLGGWDSDNPTSTMGGLLGSLHGETAIEEAFAPTPLSKRYIWSNTRDNLTDYILDDPADDTFALMAERMMPIIDKAVVAAGGVVDTANDRWIMPDVDLNQALKSSPTEKLYRRSANNMLRLDGISVTPGATVAGTNLGSIADGLEQDFSGRELMFTGKGPVYSSPIPASAGAIRQVWVLYGEEIEIDAVRFIEGDRQAGVGGWFEQIELSLLINGEWQTVPDAVQSEALEPDRPFQIIDLMLQSPMLASGIRLTGTAGGSSGWITVSELDAVLVPEPRLAFLAASLWVLPAFRRRRA